MVPGNINTETVVPSLTETFYYARLSSALVIGPHAAIKSDFAFFWALQSGNQKKKTMFIEKSTMPLSEKKLIAVLPFVDLSGDSDQNYICKGIPEQVITSLLDVPGVHVVAARDPLLVQGRGNGNVYPIVEKRGARYVLEGSAQCLNNQVRITIRMVDLSTSRYLWAKTFDRELKDMFALQDEIATTIISMLQERKLLAIGNADGQNIEANDMDLLFSEDGVVI